MSDPQTWSFEGLPVRTLTVNAEPWWVLADVCKALGLSDVRRVAERLDEDERSQTPVIDSIGRLQPTYTVNESGLYSVILRSDKPEAKRFKKWVTSEVLPSIRKNGMYMTEKVAVEAAQDPAEFMAKALLMADSIIKKITVERDQASAKSKQLESTLEAQRPAMIFAEAVASSVDSILVRELAKLICDSGTKIGQNRLFQLLREHGYVVKRGTEPTQKAVDLGVLELIERLGYPEPTKPKLFRTTKVTGKGQIYFVKKVQEWIDKATVQPEFEF